LTSAASNARGGFVDERGSAMRGTPTTVGMAMPPRGVTFRVAALAPRSGCVSGALAMGARRVAAAGGPGGPGGRCGPGAALSFGFEGTARFSASAADMRCEIGPGRVECGAAAGCGRADGLTEGGGREIDELDDGGSGIRTGCGT
jgi:hypothetical protein